MVVFSYFQAYLLPTLSMENQDGLIDELSQRIEQLEQKHVLIHDELKQVQRQVADLKAQRLPSPIVTTVAPPAPERARISQAQEPSSIEKKTINVPPSMTAKSKSAATRAPLEEFIGTNLLNKIGIAILVIGIGFGTKYAIDHDLLSPLTRIILGYVCSLTIIVVAIRLKTKYESFSAVLLSGGMAALYFVTYAAYDFYDLIPQTIAFILMVLFTVFTVFAAIQYNLQTIAIIGLVGAYAVPFLLSDGSGRVVVMFIYMTIINTGILVLAFKKYWKNLYYLAFLLTWIIFGAWYGTAYSADEHFWTSVFFSTLFFVIFYATFLAYKLIRMEALEKLDVVFVMLNSFLHFGFGYATVSSLTSGEAYLGLFTVLTAVLHFIVCVIIYKKQKTQNNDSFYLVAGMVLIFITLAVPIQLEGHWVTLIWAAEALLLFWIGRTKTFPVYEKLSYTLIIISFVSLVHDWDSYYKLHSYYADGIKYEHVSLFSNIQFFTSLWVAASLGIILLISRNKHYTSPLKEGKALHTIFTILIPALFGAVVYFAFFKEIQVFWDRRFTDSGVLIKSVENGAYTLYDNDLLKFQTLWLLNYSAIVGIVITFLNLRFINDKTLSYVSAMFNGLVIAAFLSSGLVELADLRSSYLAQDQADYYFRGMYHIMIRYIGLVFVVPLMLCNHLYIKNTTHFNETLQKTEQGLFHFVVVVLLSSELVHWLDMARVENSFKLALSILWGAYALFLIMVGLWKNQKHIRIMAFALFGITLIKLFAYDMADMSTIAKTIVMMALGVLLLVASFLYNKYKRTNENQ